MRGTDAAAAMADLGIPVVYLSAFSDEETLRIASETLPYGYLTKPSRLEDIRSTLSMTFARIKREQEEQELIEQEKQFNAMKSRFLAMASHDLRTPLTVIMMAVEVLKLDDERISTAKRQEKLNQIQQAIYGMRSQLEDLLAQERLESGGLAFEPSPTDVLELCETTISDVNAATGGKCPIACQHDSLPPTLPLDSSLLRYALTNLLSNAVKYSAPGQAVVLAIAYDADELRLQVRDRGIGIPDSFRERLFQPFQRANNVGAIKGTGIGLYIVKAAVDRHQGTVEVESQPDAGTTFTIHLPINVPNPA
jgi:signal transduction histidine kinase